MERYQRHRYALVLPFILLALVMLVGGLANGVTAAGRLIDDYTSDPVKDGELTMGRRKAWSAEDGTFVMESVPRTTSIRVDAGGYFRTHAPPEGGDVRLAPNSITVQVNVEGAEPVVGVPAAQIRQETRVLATANSTGGANVAPHPGRNAKVTICAKGYRTKEVTVSGVTLVVTLPRDETGDCAPLPTPTPNPNVTPIPSPGVSPSPGASPLPAASPSPGASPSPSPSPR